jgi:hypothetical protein
LIFYLFRILIGETTDVGRVLPLSLSPLSPRVHPCECGCIHEDPLFPIPPRGFCGWSAWRCLAVFPRLKGRKNVSLFFLFDYLTGLICDTRSTIIPELGGWLELFSLSVFVNSVRIHIHKKLICELTTFSVGMGTSASPRFMKSKGRNRNLVIFFSFYWITLHVFFILIR